MRAIIVVTKDHSLFVYLFPLSPQECVDGWENPDEDCKIPTEVGTCPDGVVTCMNGGTCFDGQCCCQDGYEGDECGTEIDECASNPCLNEGDCTQPEAGMYECQCQDGTLVKATLYSCLIKVLNLYMSDDVFKKIQYCYNSKGTLIQGG